MSQCTVSLRKLKNLHGMLDELLQDGNLHSSDEILKCVRQAFGFTEERHSEHMARQIAATKKYQARQKEAGIVRRYTETRKRYYLEHKDEINRKRNERRRIIREAQTQEIESM